MKKSLIKLISLIFLSIFITNCMFPWSDKNKPRDYTPSQDVLYLAKGIGIVKAVYINNTSNTSYTYEINISTDSSITQSPTSNDYFPCSNNNICTYIFTNYSSGETVSLYNETTLFTDNLFNNRTTVYQIENKPDEINSIFSRYEYIESTDTMVALLGVKSKNDLDIYKYSVPIKIFETNGSGQIFNEEVYLRNGKYRITATMETDNSISGFGNVYKITINYLFISGNYNSLLSDI